MRLTIENSPVSIAEAILWGEQLCQLRPKSPVLIVSIAEAILWGEQLCKICTVIHEQKFQSQRRFFGGSNQIRQTVKAAAELVSIAEAILWGEQLGVLLSLVDLW